ncbi:hypothetical protein BGY98DRAFT_74112 [Russula aff. rugulosa BPL654]|nr:hypothetical protein BGY98DRAFT_74112 [Russula aff. rugulosa BPL654]
MPAPVCFRLPLLYLISLEHHPTRFGRRQRPILLEIHHLSQNAIQSHSSFGTPLPPPFLTLFFFGLIFILIVTQCYYAPLISFTSAHFSLICVIPVFLLLSLQIFLRIFLGFSRTLFKPYVLECTHA